MGTIYDVKSKLKPKQLGLSPLKGKFGEGLDPEVDPVGVNGDAAEDETADVVQQGKEKHRRNESRDDDTEEAAEGEVPHPPPSSSGALPDDGEDEEAEESPGKPADAEPGEMEDLPSEEMDYDDAVDVDEDVDGYDADDDEEEWDEEDEEGDEAPEGEDVLAADGGVDDGDPKNMSPVPPDASEPGGKRWPDRIPPPRPAGVQNDVLKVWADRRQPRRKKVG